MPRKKTTDWPATIEPPKRMSAQPFYSEDGGYLEYYQEKLRWQSEGYSARKQGAKWALTFRDWMIILWKSRGHCYYCGHNARESGALVLEHVYPLSQGGAHSRWNIVAACNHCNVTKLNLTPDEWLARMQASGDRLRLIPRVASIVRHKRYQLDKDVSAPVVVPASTQSEASKRRGRRQYEVWVDGEQLRSQMTLYEASTGYSWFAVYILGKKMAYVKDTTGNILAISLPRRFSEPWA